jgi:hypothetical protein
MFLRQRSWENGYGTPLVTGLLKHIPAVTNRLETGTLAGEISLCGIPVAAYIMDHSRDCSRETKRVERTTRRLRDARRIRGR